MSLYTGGLCCFTRVTAPAPLFHATPSTAPLLSRRRRPLAVFQRREGLVTELNNATLPPSVRKREGESDCPSVKYPPAYQAPAELFLLYTRRRRDDVMQAADESPRGDRTYSRRWSIAPGKRLVRVWGAIAVVFIYGSWCGLPSKDHRRVYTIIRVIGPLYSYGPSCFPIFANLLFSLYRIR